MTLTDQILVIILCVLMSLFFIIMLAVALGLLKVVSSVKRVVAKAEDVVDNVESAAEVLRDTSGRMAFFKVVRNIMKVVKDRK